MPKPWKANPDPKKAAYRHSGIAMHTLADRFAAKIQRDPKTGCHEWTGGKNHAGYGMIWTGGRPYQRPAHRIALELAGVVIPEGMFIDHVCRNRGCVNTDHLRIVTPKQNALENNDSPFAINSRKTHCSKGHPLSGTNIVFIRQRNPGKTSWTTSRACLTCFPTYRNSKRRIYPEGQ